MSGVQNAVQLNDEQSCAVSWSWWCRGHGGGSSDEVVVVLCESGHCGARRVAHRATSGIGRAISALSGMSVSSWRGSPTVVPLVGLC